MHGDPTERVWTTNLIWGAWAVLGHIAMRRDEIHNPFSVGQLVRSKITFAVNRLATSSAVPPCVFREKNTSVIQLHSNTIESFRVRL